MDSPLTAAITRYDIAHFIDTLVAVYVVLIFIRILLSFIPRMPYNTTLRAVTGFVEEVTDPYLRLWRKVLPPLRAGGAMLDLTPMIATIALIFAGQIVTSLIISV